MDNTSVNTASGQAAAAGSAFEPASDFAFAPEPAAQATGQQDTQAAGQKGAGAVDAQRSADAQGNELRKDFAQNRFQPNRSQKDTGKAFAKESERVRTQAERDYAAKLEADPDRAIARRLVTDLMRSKGITEEQARQELDNGFYAAIAEREGISPGMARMLYAQQQATPGANPAQDAKTQPTQPQQQSDDDVADAAMQIVEELASMRMPEGFDIETAAKDPVFAELLLEHAPASAVKIYQLQLQATSATQEAANAPQALADKLRSRAEIPQSSRSSSAAAPPNFKNMTTEEFRQYQREHHLT